MSRIKIICEGDIKGSTDALETSWADSPTFLFLPGKGAASPIQLDQMINLIPPAFRDDCFGILTSGSTGQPKLILGRKKRTENLVRLLHDLQNSESVSETLAILPLTYSYAFVNQWLWSFQFNRKLHLSRGFSEPDHLRDQLLKAHQAMICMVGSQVALLRRYFPELVFHGIIRLHFAGGRFPQEQLDFLRHAFPNAQIYNNYGCAEAMPRLTLRRAEDALEASHIGFPLPGIEMKADDEHRLMFRSPFGAVAYVSERGFRAVNRDDWIPSGDLGVQLDDGSWRLLGRANDVFKRHGEKISLDQLLTTVNSNWAGDSAFYQEVDKAGEQGYVLVICPVPSVEEVRQLLMAFRNNHSRPQWPLRIESLTHMPLLSNGKTDIQALATAEGNQIHWRQRI